MPEEIKNIYSRKQNKKKERESASLFNKLLLTSGFRLVDRSWSALSKPLRGSVLKAVGSLKKWSHGVGEGDPCFTRQSSVCVHSLSHLSSRACLGG